MTRFADFKLVMLMLVELYFILMNGFANVLELTTKIGIIGIMKFTSG